MRLCINAFFWKSFGFLFGSVALKESNDVEGCEVADANAEKNSRLY